MVFLFRGLNNTNNIEATEFANTEKQEVGSQKTEDGGRETEAGSQEIEDGGWETEDAIQELVASNQESEDGSQKSGDGSWNEEVGSQELVARNKKQETSTQQPVIINKEPEQEEQQLATNTLNLEPETLNVEKDSILIAPVHEQEILYAENETPIDNKKPLTIPQFLKKEVNQRILNDEAPQKNKPAEVVVADILAKAAGRKGSVDKTKNDEGEVEEYALNIGGFSFSRKVRK